MQNKNLIRFVESFVLLPILTVSMPFGSVPKDGVSTVLYPTAVLSAKENIGAFGAISPNQEVDSEAFILKTKAEAIDAYFREHDMPLEGKGMKMVEEAEKNDLDWRLLAAISVRESTGGKHDCERVKNNPFGWGSCKIGFETLDKAIETLALNLGGNNPKTARHYDGKNTKEILQKYNPPSIVAKYADQVISIMNDISEKDVSVKVAYY